MKVSNFNIVNMLSTLNEFEEKKLPQKISYAITRNIVLLNSDYDCYMKSLNKILKTYESEMVKDIDGNIIYGDNGLPIVNEKVSKEFNEEIVSLLNIELDIDIYHIQEDLFNYDDEKYDSLSAKDILRLQSVLCE